MLSHDSPFKSDVELLELPFRADGSFAWVENTPRHSEWAIGERIRKDLPARLAALLDTARQVEVLVPKEFVTFLENPRLHEHLRSVTACYLNVPRWVFPFAGGYLIRFLADQQGCAYWYLYIAGRGPDHCVVCEYDYFNPESPDFNADDLKIEDFHFCAESFEAFLMRFWLENEILFARYDSTPPPDVPARFLKLYGE